MKYLCLLAAWTALATAAALPPTLLQLSPAGLVFPVQLVGACSPPQIVTIANAGTAAVTITGWSVLGAGFQLAAAAATPLTLPPGGVTHVSIRFAAGSAAGSFSGSLQVWTAAGEAAAPVALSAAAALPRVTVSAEDFGMRHAGSTSTLHTLWVTNSGVVPAVISRATHIGSPFSIYSITHLPVTLDPGASTGITVTFTPPRSGNYTGSLDLSGPNGLSAGGTVTGSGVGTAGIVISSLPQLAYLAQAARLGIGVSGGEPPYHFSRYWSSGPLPPGMSLTADGQLTGTPAQAGDFPLLVQVTDSSPAPLSATAVVPVSVASYSLDAYGGVMQESCPAQARFSTVKIGGRWWLCTPAGHLFWMKAVYDAAATDSGADAQGVVESKLVQAKYARGPSSNPTFNWALASVRRLQAWGFNALGEYAVGWTLPIGVSSQWNTPDNAIPVKLPFVGFLALSKYALSDQNGYAPQAAKDLLAGVRTGVFTGYRSHVTDVFDPNWRQWLETDLGADTWIQRALNGPNKSYLIGLNVDDADDLEGFGAGPDFPTVANGAAAPGRTQPHLGWIVLVTASEQSFNAKLNQIYADPTVYAKRALAQWLSQKYAGNIAALDAAWGADYTTFGSSGGWGGGSGLLDEDGTCPAARLQVTPPPCWVPRDAYQLNGATAAMRQDLDGFLLDYATQYFSTIRSVLQQAAPGVLYLGPTTLGTWGAPPRRQVLQAASTFVDVFMLSSLPPDCANCNDLQQRLDFVARWGGDKPWMDWEGYQARADSYMSPYAAAGDELSTQAARAVLYRQRLAQIAHAHDTLTGTEHFIGLKWWALYDSRGEKANWGLITRRDDPYDGVASRTSPGVDAWGYPTGCLSGVGCEQGDYGDFLGPVTAANQSLYPALLGLP